MLIHNLAINFTNLCQLPIRAHVYLTDQNHCLLGANALQLSVNEKLSGSKKSNDFLGLSLFDIYHHHPKRAQDLCQENEKVLRLKETLTVKSTLIIPNHTTIDFLTHKMPCYDNMGKVVSVIGISYYLREIKLDLAREYKLTDREISCLDYLLLNQTAKEIAVSLSLSARTVEDYLDKAKHKLNCQNKAELIKKLKKIKLITRY